MRTNFAIEYFRNIRAAAALRPPVNCHTIDVETSMEGPDADPMPYGPKGAKILLWAHKGKSTPAYVCYRLPMTSFMNSALIVGHNLKFDWQHLCQEAGHDLTRNTRRHRQFMFWDTGIAEYVLTGQREKFASLNTLAVRYCAASKDTTLEDALKAGKRSQDIPLSDLSKYAMKDVWLTEEIMCKQWAGANANERALIMVLSALSIIFAEAEFDGMHINVGEAMRRRDTEYHKSSSVRSMLKEVMCKLVLTNTYHTGFGFDVADACGASKFATPRALSMLMFGFPTMLDLEAPLPVPVGRLKKARVIAKCKMSWPVLNPADYGAAKHSDGQSYLLDDAVLRAIMAGQSEVHKELASAILTARASEKKATTYYQGLLERNEKYGDHTVHHTLNMTATATGRTSSSNPNSQNQPEEVKEIFEPSLGYTFCEFDFKQLEVWALAVISGDEQLLGDLMAGVDIHYETGKAAGLWKTAVGMTKDLRRRVKSVVFGLIYGGGAKTLSEQAELEEGIVGRIITAFYARYRQVKAFHTDICKEVNNPDDQAPQYMAFVEDGTRLTSEGSSRVRIMRVVHPHAFTGRMYGFIESDKTGPGGGKSWAAKPFSPTNIKNYIIQGFATGDFVPVALVALDMDLIPGAGLVTAVHDSGLLKVTKTSEAEMRVDESMHELSKTTVEAFHTLWGIALPMAPGISVEWRSTWGGSPARTYTV